MTLCNPMDCSLPVSCPWNSSGKNTGVGCHALLHGIFPTQEDPRLLHLLHWQVGSLPLGSCSPCYYYCRINDPKTQWLKINNHFIKLPDPVGQELRWFFSSSWHQLMFCSDIQLVYRLVCSTSDVIASISSCWTGMAQIRTAPRAPSPCLPLWPGLPHSAADSYRAAHSSVHECSLAQIKGAWPLWLSLGSHTASPCHGAYSL